MNTTTPLNSNSRAPDLLFANSCYAKTVALWLGLRYAPTNIARANMRDEISFGLGLRDPMEEKASRTPRRAYGDRSIKTNLQIALLRSLRIPARYHYVRAKGDILKGLSPKFIVDRFPMDMGYFWCECYLSGQWIACETLIDEPLYKGMLSEGLVTVEQIPTIDWDGETEFILLKPWIVKDMGAFTHYEESVKELMKSGYTEEGSPPRIFMKLFGWFPYSPPNQRMNKIREGRREE